MTIQILLDAWIISGAFHDVNPPASEAEITEAEQKIGAVLPPPLRELYRCFNGGWTLDRVFYPLQPTPNEDIALINANAKYAEWEWHIPKEIRLFADEGAGHVFGIWITSCDNPIFSHPIIEFGVPTDADGWMGIYGTNLISFLLGWSAVQLMGQEETASSEEELRQIQMGLNMLQVPQSLRAERFDENQFDNRHAWDDPHVTQIRKWADPNLPDPSGNCYSQQYTISDLKRIFSET